MPTLFSPTFDIVGESATARLTTPAPPRSFYDRYDPDEPFRFTTPGQRQQNNLPPNPNSPVPPSPVAARSTPASHHRLRRTPNFLTTPSPRPRSIDQENTRPTAPVTVALGPTGRYVLADDVFGPKRPSNRPKATRKLSQGNLSSSSVATSSSFRRPTVNSGNETEQPESHPVLHISKNTHNAVLYALEATLRGPSTISIDPVEAYSRMADLMSGRGPATSNGNGTPSIRAPSGRSAVGSPSGIRGPKEIMQRRAEREATKQREAQEQERLKQEHLKREARLQQEAERTEAQRMAAERENDMRRANPAGAGPSAAGVNPSTSRQPAQPDSNRPVADNGGHVGRTPGMPSSTQAQASQPTRNEQGATKPHGQPGPSATGARPSGAQSQPGDFSTAVGRGRNSFPHAFERWENLSSHWEGLTSFWIRRLQHNSAEIEGDPIAQQLSRQVTDLSSAGANLFHAVVELQRLRASSERKFQRWFFETRSELERNQEVTAMLEVALEEERRNRADAIRKAVEEEQGSSKLHKQLAEMRKELTISKEEARRAWEELGRREQEERDRTNSLQLGHPTIVGGVQVVPMTQGVSRGNTQREPRYVAPTEMPEYGQSPPRTARPEYTQAPAVQPAPMPSGSGGPNPAFQNASSVQHQQSYASEGTMSEGQYIRDASGNFIRDARGQKIPYHVPPSEGSDV